MMKRFAATSEKNMFLPKNTRTHTFISVHAHCTVVRISRWSPADSIIWNKKRIRMKKKTYVPNPSGVYLIAFFLWAFALKKCWKKRNHMQWVAKISERKTTKTMNTKNWTTTKKTNNVNETSIKNNTGTHNDPPKKTNNNSNSNTVCASKTHSSVKNRLWCVTISTHHPISINIVTNYQFLCSKTWLSCKSCVCEWAHCRSEPNRFVCGVYTTIFSAHNSKRFAVARVAAVVVVLVDVEHFSAFSSFLVFPFSLFSEETLKCTIHFFLLLSSTFSMPTAGLSVRFFFLSFF